MNKYLVHIESQKTASHLEIIVDAASFEVFNGQLIFCEYDSETLEHVEMAIFKEWTFVKKVVEEII